MKARPRKGVFYGYVIVAASVLILVTMHGTGASFGIFFSRLQAEFGWDRATISGASSLGFFLLGLFSVVAGRVTDRYGPRFTLAIGSVALVSGYLLLSGLHSLWQLYLWYGVVVAIGNSAGDMALLPTVVRWFVKRRSLMSSLVKVGTGIGMFVMPLVAGWLIVSFGWRASYAVLGVLVGVVVFALSRLVRRDPSEMGMRPYGADEAGDSSNGSSGVNFSLREVLRTRQFWVLCSAYFLVWYSTQSTVIHIAPHGVDMGLTVRQTAAVVSGIGAASIPGRLVMGWVADRTGTRRAVVVCFVILLAALAWLRFAPEPWMLYAFAPVYGFAHGGFFAILSPMVADLFGVRAHASNLGMLFFVGMSGGAVGPIVTGRIFDMTQDYGTAFLVMLLAAVIGLVLMLLLRPVTGTQNLTRNT